VFAPEQDQDKMALSFSPDGLYLLVDSRAQYDHDPSNPDENGLARVLPVKGGDAVPVARDVPVAFPTWSPSGHAIAFLSRGESLQVVGEPNGQPRELQKGTAYTSADRLRLNWTARQIVLFVQGKATVFMLSG
jgi:hypothetical protein